MGLPPGWVADLDLPRTAQLRALGNGVVPQQVAYALTALLADFAALTRGEHRGCTAKAVRAACPGAPSSQVPAQRCDCCHFAWRRNDQPSNQRN